MAKENIPNEFGGFEALAGAILDSPKEDEIPEVDPDKLLEEEEIEENEEEVEEEVETEETEETEEEEEDTETSDVEEESEELDFGEYEAPLAELFQEELYAELGWEVEDGDKVESVKDLVEKLTKAVSESATPQYANEQLQRLDSFVKQGGKLEDYFEKVPAGRIDLEDPDLTNENVQKDLIREYLSTVRGYKEDRINRTLARHEDGGILEEEAEDALELLKEYKAAEQERLLEAQEKYAENVKAQQQKFYSDVEDSVNNLKEIRGIKISEREKRELLDYIFKPESDGRTKYQKEYSSDVEHLIESAFFTKDKKKNTLVTKAKQSAKTDAYKEIHQKIKASKGKRQKGSRSQEETAGSDTLSKLGHSLIKKV